MRHSHQRNILILLAVTALIISMPLYAFASTGGRVLQKGRMNYLSNTIVVKLKSTAAKANKTAMLSPGLSKSLSAFSVNSVKSVFNAASVTAAADLSRIVELNYNSDADPFYVAAKLKNNPDVEWAEPHYVYKISDSPNDPFFNNQYNLSIINASQAWDVIKGDTNIVIGIVDTGIDWDHPDLAPNIWINKKEIPNNGIDDDNNGYVDDVRGWDFGGLTGTPDNDPMEDKPDHGSHVAGIASAVTNNSRGVAAIGYNSKIMAVKTSENSYRNADGDPYIVFGFEGIVYAVDNGAKIINCSWGGDGYSAMAFDVIKYAISKGSLVVVAAGNESSKDDSYPACYDGVLSVAATDQKDILAYYSNYGKKTGVCAPGSNIYSTWQNDTYTYLSGTSMSAPLVSGLAALVAARFQTYTPLQIAEQIRVNADNIDNVNSGSLNGLLGSGRINAYKAVSNTASKSVRLKDIQFSDAAPGGNGNGIFEPGETITITCKFENYLNPVSGLTVTLNNQNTYSTIKQGTFTSGAVGSLAEFDNSANKFSITISPNAPYNASLDFKLLYSDGTYSDFQWISLIANPSYGTQNANDVSLTINGKGNIGFNDYPNNKQGDGFKYKNGSNLLFEGSLILANSATKVSDESRGANVNAADTDFVNTQPFLIKQPGTIADAEGYSIFNDNGAGSNKLGINVEQTSYSFNNTDDANYIILKYVLTNTTNAAINNLYAGLFTDWDLVEESGTGDQTQFDTVGQFGYVYHPGGSPNDYAAVAVISASNAGYWGILNDGSDGGFQIYDSFTDAEKWKALSSGIGKAKAGPGDISCVNSSGPYNIPAGGKVTVAFALAGGYSVDDLRTAVANAKKKYPQVITAVAPNSVAANPYSFGLEQNYPNPFNPSTVIKYQTPAPGNVSVKVFDMLGREVSTLVNEYKPAGSYSVEFNTRLNNGRGDLPSGVYIYRIQAGNYTASKKMVLVR